MIFVVGNSRSGTTLMGRILGKHPSVFTFREIHFFEQIWTSDDKGVTLSRDDSVLLIAKLLLIENDGYLTQGSTSRFVEIAESVLSEWGEGAFTKETIFHFMTNYFARINGKTIPCDQTPRNLFYLDEILEIYPDALIVNMIRDPRDILLSQKNKWKRRLYGGGRNIPRKELCRSWINYHPITISKLWKSAVRVVNKFTNHPRVICVRFEDLLTNPQKKVKEICSFLGIQYSDDQLDVPQVGSSHGQDNPSKRGIKLRQGMNWQNGALTNTEIFLCQKITHNEMKEHGYSAVLVKPSILSVSISALLWPLKLSLAVVVNISRTKNIFDAIKRRLI